MEATVPVKALDLTPQQMLDVVNELQQKCANEIQKTEQKLADLREEKARWDAMAS